MDLSEHEWLRAIGNRHRLAILRYFLAHGSATVLDVATGLRSSPHTVRHHVNALVSDGILRIAGQAPRRGAPVPHYQLVDRHRVASLLWGVKAELLVTDVEHAHGRGDVTAVLDAEALAELELARDAFLARVGELDLQTRVRRAATRAENEAPPTVNVAVLLHTDEPRQT